jgi:hypothetical protein
MITKKIFLASSKEMEKERAQLKIFIAEKNDAWHKQGVYLELVGYENFSESMSAEGLQSEYDKAILKCDIFIMLFHQKVGEFSAGEFEVAYKQFMATGKPLIFTYAKKIQIPTGGLGEDIKSLLTFKKHLRDLKHYCSAYKNVHQLIHEFNKQMDKLLFENFSIPAKPETSAAPYKIDYANDETIFAKLILKHNHFSGNFALVFANLSIVNISGEPQTIKNLILRYKFLGRTHESDSIIVITGSLYAPLGKKNVECLIIYQGDDQKIMMDWVPIRSRILQAPLLPAGGIINGSAMFQLAARDHLNKLEQVQLIVYDYSGNEYFQDVQIPREWLETAHHSIIEPKDFVIENKEIIYK